MYPKTETQKNIVLTKRPPIVVVMGHVDHGKTSILDYIRKSKVAEKESGGITQHIGAYEIEITTKDKEQRKITFIDTPGHEAFTKMRGRGAKVADIAVLVIAADEGFKPQTKEALQIIKTEKIPFIAAANKIDKPNTNIEIIKKECGENDIYIEEWGGEIPFVPVSSKTGAGMEELLETIILLSDISNFSGDAALPAEGIVIESHLDKQRGNTATLIIKNGTLKKGDYIVCGDSIAPIKVFENFLGQGIDSASFSSPALIAGFNKISPVGSEFKSFKTKLEAENYLKNYEVKNIAADFVKLNKEENILTIPLVLKADTAGSLEAIHGELLKLRNENVKIDILSEKTGDINEDDVKLASINENSMIIGFNVSADKTAKNVLERFSVKYNSFSIIYKLTEWLKEEIERRAPIEIKEDLVGKIEILKVFKKDMPKEILGGKVLSGKIIKGGYLKPQIKFKEIASAPAQAIGKITELEKNKAKADEVKEGNEFGIMAEVKKEIKEGDILEVYEKQTLKRKLY